MFSTRLYWVLHVLGALLFAMLASICFAPDHILPESLHSARDNFQRDLTVPLIPYVAPDSTQDEDSGRVLIQMIREKYEDEIEQLKKERNHLKAKVPR